MSLAYDGTPFKGWQRQLGAPTIQETIEKAIQKITGQASTLYGAGRTDAGVHALRQAANFRTFSILSTDVLIRALNASLPPSIRIMKMVEVEPGFHARKSARGKRYVYRFFLGRDPLPFGREYYTVTKYKLSVQAMRDGAAKMQGTQDFAAFATNPGYERGSTVKTLEHVHLIRRGRFLLMAVQGDGFLYNMVRTIAGTLVEVGRGRFSAHNVTEILASRDRRLAGPVLPPGGLFMTRVLYDDPRLRQ